VPVYGTPQAGGLTALAPGESMKLFDAETPGAATASIPFARAISASQDDAGTTFQIIAAAVGVLIQCSNVDVAADYVTVYTSVSLIDAYTDIGRSAFYRAVSPGGLITVIAQR
jgi:hypothetical protein